MIATMYDAPGVGLAAPQVGADLRITVIDCTDLDEESVIHVLINPEIIEREGKIIWEEGCLSIPGVFSEVERAQAVTVRALNTAGKSFKLVAEDLLAVCLQHEIDHLDGVLFLDHLSRLKLRMALKTYKRTLPAHLDLLKEDGDEVEEGRVE
jgi:peptide deformylase